MFFFASFFHLQKEDRVRVHAAEGLLSVSLWSFHCLRTLDFDTFSPFITGNGITSGRWVASILPCDPFFVSFYIRYVLGIFLLFLPLWVLLLPWFPPVFQFSTNHPIPLLLSPLFTSFTCSQYHSQFSSHSAKSLKYNILRSRTN